MKIKIELQRWWAYFGVTMFLLVTLGLLVNIAFFDVLTLTYLFAGCGLAAATIIKLAKNLLSSKEIPIVENAAKGKTVLRKVRNPLEEN